MAVEEEVDARAIIKMEAVKVMVAHLHEVIPLKNGAS
jgi:hypothetical protein